MCWNVGQVKVVLFVICEYKTYIDVRINTYFKMEELDLSKQ